MLEGMSYRERKRGGKKNGFIASVNAKEGRYKALGYVRRKSRLSEVGKTFRVVRYVGGAGFCACLRTFIRLCFKCSDERSEVTLSMELLKTLAFSFSAVSMGEHGVTLRQAFFIRQILNSDGMLECKPANTPLAVASKMARGGPSEAQ